MPRNSLRRSRSARGLIFASLTAAALSAAPAFAADRPATQEGADAIKALIARYFPAAQAGPTPLVTVALDGNAYRLSADLGALNALLKGAGVSYEPATLVYRAVEQDDGNWRFAMDSLPRIVFHSDEATGAIELTNFRSTALIGPAVAWILGGSANADKGTLRVETPDVVETVDFGSVEEAITTGVAAGPSVSTQVKEDISAIVFKATGAGANDGPIDVSGQLDKATITAGVDGFKSRKAFDLWSLIASHPERADLAAHEDELKGLLRDLTAPALKLSEGFEAQKALVTSPLGAVTLAEARYQLAAANAGPQSSLDLSLSAEGLSLPAGLLPASAADLTPSKIDLAATVRGFDLTAALTEWISRLSLKGDGPIISEEDADKIEAALLSAGPIRLEIAPSHVVAPAVDADFAGAVRIENKKPIAALTVRARGFDKTMAAVQALGPEIAAQAFPALALAKGLAKGEGDGSLSWLVELDANRSIKVNGIPFGKAPE